MRAHLLVYNLQLPHGHHGHNGRQGNFNCGASSQAGFILNYFLSNLPKFPQISSHFLHFLPARLAGWNSYSNPDDHHSHHGCHDHDGRHGHGDLGDHGGSVDQCGHVNHGGHSDHGGHGHGQNCHSNLTFQETCEGKLSQFLQCLFSFQNIGYMSNI